MTSGAFRLEVFICGVVEGTQRTTQKGGLVGSPLSEGNLLIPNISAQFQARLCASTLTTNDKLKAKWLGCNNVAITMSLCAILEF